MLIVYFSIGDVWYCISLLYLVAWHVHCYPFLSSIFGQWQEGATLMHYAVQTASSHAIKILLLYNVDINLQDNVCLILPICALLFMHAIDVFENALVFHFQDGWTPLHLAVQTRRTDLVRLLLIKGADRTLKNQVNMHEHFCTLFTGCFMFLFSRWCLRIYVTTKHYHHQSSPTSPTLYSSITHREIHSRKKKVDI